MKRALLLLPLLLLAGCSGNPLAGLRDDPRFEALLEKVSAGDPERFFALDTAREPVWRLDPGVGPAAVAPLVRSAGHHYHIIAKRLTSVREYLRLHADRRFRAAEGSLDDPRALRALEESQLLEQGAEEVQSFRDLVEEALFVGGPPRE